MTGMMVQAHKSRESRATMGAGDVQVIKQVAKSGDNFGAMQMSDCVVMRRNE